MRIDGEWVNDGWMDGQMRIDGRWMDGWIDEHVKNNRAGSNYTCPKLHQTVPA